MKSQSGNALFLILIAVALFAALSYAVTNSGRGGGGVDKEQVSINASQIVQYLSTIDQAITRLRVVNGCSDTEISFHYDSDGDGTLETNGEDAYYNPSASTDCYVFQPTNLSGAAIQSIPSKALDGDVTHATHANYGKYFFDGGARVKGVGTDCDLAACSELFVAIPFLSEAIATEINKRMGITPNAPTIQGVCNLDYVPGQMFIGAYTDQCGATSQYGNTATAVEGHQTACIYRADLAAGFDNYECYHVLIAR